MTSADSKLSGVNILLGVTGGIAAYKAVDLASRLTAAGAKVNCVMTKNACELIRPKSFEAVTGRQVFTNMWSSASGYEIGHINLIDETQIIVVAPATANIIGKMANGICDDLLSTILCARGDTPTLIAPAMNSNMWANPAVQKNIETIRQMGIRTIGPETGRLACGTEGPGRMTEPADIIKQIASIVS